MNKDNPNTYAVYYDAKHNFYGIKNVINNGMTYDEAVKELIRVHNASPYTHGDL